MKKNTVLHFSAIFFVSLTMASKGDDVLSTASWTVVGAGPSGIMALGIILDSGVPAHKIVWIDPEFNVGRMGSCYQNVPGNGTVQQYLMVLKTSTLFHQVKSEAIDLLHKLPLDHTPKLKLIIDPFLDITRYFCTKVIALRATMRSLNFKNNQWHITTDSTSFCSKNVVLATGAHPRVLQYEGIEQIPLDIALDKDALAKMVTPEDTVAVIGSAHSALLVVRHLTELPVSRIINFYTNPIVYPTPMHRGIAWQETGLKGELATWTKTVLDVNPPKNLIRVRADQESLAAYLPECTKIIYAVGFERNDLPFINGDKSLYEEYDKSTGIIAPHCYGVGIAFPQEKVDPLGNVEYLVGLPYLKFDALYDALYGKN